MDLEGAGGVIANGVGGSDGHRSVANREPSSGSLRVTQSRQGAVIGRNGGWVVYHRSRWTSGVGVLVRRARSDCWGHGILNDDSLGLTGGIAMAVIIGPVNDECALSAVGEGIGGRAAGFCIKGIRG